MSRELVVAASTWRCWSQGRIGRWILEALSPADEAGVRLGAVKIGLRWDPGSRRMLVEVERREGVWEFSGALSSVESKREAAFMAGCFGAVLGGDYRDRFTLDPDILFREEEIRLPHVPRVEP